MKVNLTQEEFVAKFKSNFKLINDPVILDYREKILTIDESGTPRNLFFYLPDQKTSDKIKVEFSAIFSSLQKLVKYIIYEKPDLLRFLDKQNIDIDALKKRDSATLLGYARIDTIFGDEKFSVLEFNSRRPQMYEDADWFSEFTSRSVGFENVEQEENGYEILESIQSHFEINTKRKVPETVVVLNNFPNHRYPFSSLTKLHSYFDQSNIFTFNCESIDEFYSKIALRDSGLFYEEVKVDLIILQSVCGKKSLFGKQGGIRDSRIAQAYNKQLVEIYTQPSSQISGTKLALDLIKSKEIQIAINLDEEEINAVKTIPESIHSENITDFSQFNKNDYVVKLTGRGQGHGVILGSEMSESEWKDAIESRKSNDVKFLLQERINFSETQIFNISTCRFEKAFLTLEPFVINNPTKSQHPFVSGYSTRAIPVDKFVSNLKFNPAKGKSEIYFGALVETKA